MYEKKGFETLTPYIAGKPMEAVAREYGLTEIVKLASNENPLGTSPRVREALAAQLDRAALYPDGGCTALREALAEYYNIPADWFVFGTGSDGLIELAAKSFLEAGTNAVLSEQTFSLYHTNTVANGASVKAAPLDAQYRYDLDALRAAIDSETRVVWLCNPNNPTGTVYSQEEQAAFLDSVPEEVLVVVDEAYYEYAADSFPQYPDTLAEVRKRPNVLLLRTFSKLFGLAGLRVGYGIAPPSLIAEMEKVRPPFNVNSFAQAGAAAALGDEAFAAQTLACNRENMAFLCSSLDRLGLTYLPSHTNFVMVDVGRDSRTVFEALLQRGVIVKAGAGFGMDTFLRVTVGTRAQCERFLEALQETLHQ